MNIVILGSIIASGTFYKYPTFNPKSTTYYLISILIIIKGANETKAAKGIL